LMEAGGDFRDEGGGCSTATVMSVVR
jgi:hypothetical protein